MNNLVTVISFSLPLDAHFAKGKLQSEGIEVFMKDELTAQVNHLYSSAIGGVKLQVKRDDADAAHKLLVEAGYIIEHAYKPNKLIISIDKYTASWPLIGRLDVALRLLVTITLLLTILVIAIVLVSLP